MAQADLRTSCETRWVAAALVVLLHVVLMIGLIRAFTPQFGVGVVRYVTQTFAVTVPIAPPLATAPPSLPPAVTVAERGAAAPPGRRATPQMKEAPLAQIVIKPTQAPPVAGTGRENASGAREEGKNTGASGMGAGIGAGEGGAGLGGGIGSSAVKMEGDINSARDYPRASRDLRIGAAVTIDLTVGTDGRVTGCQVVQPSPDSAADRITCDLATRRFRFRAAKDAAGRPREAIYRWRQRWFY